MADLETGKIAINMLGSYIETFDKQDSMLDLVTLKEPKPGDLQNAGNTVWKNIQQHRPRKQGWDMTGEATGIIQETVPCVLGVPWNDIIEQRADDVRDETYWNNAVIESAAQQGTGLNSDLALAAVQQGAQFYRSNKTSGYDFIAEAQAILNERQQKKSQRNYIINDRDTLTFASDLAARQTLNGMPEAVWKSGQLGQNIAGFDNVMTGSFLPNLAGGAAVTGVTVTGNQSFAPEAGAVNAVTKAVTNTDYREADIVVNNSALLAVGQKVKFQNSGVDVKALALADKNATNDAFTVTVIELTDATHIKVFPKPIALNDTALSTLEKAYANVDTQILNAATIVRLNTDTLVKPNIFFSKDAITVMGGKIPANKFAEFGGKKVIHDTLKNGLEVYMVYDGDILTMTFTFRIFVWYGITVEIPAEVGVAVKY